MPQPTGGGALRRHSKRYGAFFLLATTFLFICNKGPQTVELSDLEITIEADSTVMVRDTLDITITMDGTYGETVRYCVRSAGGITVDTIAGPSFSHAWQFPDTGIQYLVIWVVDSRNRESKEATMAVEVNYYPPEVTIDGEDQAVINDPAVFRVDAGDRDGTVDHFEWTTGTGGVFSTDAEEDSIAVTWGEDDTGFHTVWVRAVDNDGLASEPDSIEVYVDLSEPQVTLTGDTAVSVEDTALFVCAAEDNGLVAGYEWLLDSDGRRVAVMTANDTLKWVWHFPDSGEKVVAVSAFDDDNIYSAPESLIVRVSAFPPEITITGPDIVSTNDSITFRAEGEDADGEIVRYDWLVSTPAGSRTEKTGDSLLTLLWNDSDTGEYILSVTAIDDDSLESTAEPFAVKVKFGSPVFKRLEDTTLSSRDTLRFDLALLDTTISAAMFYLDGNGDGTWDDSTADSGLVLTFTGESRVTVVVAARDEDGNIYSDSLKITFDQPPAIVSQSLPDGDTVWVARQFLPGTIPFNYSVADPEGEAVTAVIAWGEDAKDSISCTDETVLPVSGPGGYGWSFVVSDSWGNRTVLNGTTRIAREHTVCFAGHSIVTGLAGDGINGGFRYGVLTGLREDVPEGERIRAVGPLVTDNLMIDYPADDSCFAISGSFAREMLLLMDHAYQELTADIWVLMLGVNGSFSDIELNSTLSMMQRMLSRNPAANIYVLTSPPFSGVRPVQRDYYNSGVRDSVAQLFSDGSAVFLVEADSLLSNVANTVVNPAYFFDDVHPNQAGYDLLAEEILDVMKNSDPPVLP